jgi:predicted Holliday junction resolvase-like endonuclease
MKKFIQALVIVAVLVPMVATAGSYQQQQQQYYEQQKQQVDAANAEIAARNQRILDAAIAKDAAMQKAGEQFNDSIQKLGNEIIRQSQESSDN